MKNNDKRKNNKIFNEMVRFLINATDVDLLAQSQSTTDEVSGLSMSPINHNFLYIDTVSAPYLKNTYDTRQNVVVSNEGFRAGKIGLIDGGNYWIQKDNMIAKRVYHSGFSINGNQSFVYGGDDTTGVSTSELFNYLQNTWNVRSGCPNSITTGISKHTSISLNISGVNGISYGGLRSSLYERTSYFYNSSVDTWSAKVADIGRDISLVCGISYSNSVGIVCGGDPTTTYAEKFDNSEDPVFSSVTTMLIPRCASCSISINSNVGATFGGNTISGTTDTGESFNLAESIWTAESNMSCSLESSNAITYNLSSLTFSESFGMVCNGSIGSSFTPTNRAARYCRPLAIWEEMMPSITSKCMAYGISMTPKIGIVTGGFTTYSSVVTDYVEAYNNGYNDKINKFSINTLYLGSDVNSVIPPDKDLYVETTILNNIMNLNMFSILANQPTYNIFSTALTLKDSKTPDPLVDVSLSGGQSWISNYKIGEIINLNGTDSYDVPEYNQTVISLFDLGVDYSDISDWVSHPIRGSIVYSKVEGNSIVKLIEFMPGTNNIINEVTIIEDTRGIDNHTTITYSEKTNRFLLAIYKYNFIYLMEINIDTFQIVNAIYIYGSTDRIPYSAVFYDSETSEGYDYYLYTRDLYTSDQIIYALQSDYIQSSTIINIAYTDDNTYTSDREIQICYIKDKLAIHTVFGGNNKIEYINVETKEIDESLTLNTQCTKVKFIGRNIIALHNDTAGLLIEVIDVELPTISTTEVLQNYQVLTTETATIAFSNAVNFVYVTFVNSFYPSTSACILSLSMRGKLIDSYIFTTENNIIINMIQETKYDCFAAKNKVYYASYINAIGKLYELKLRYKLFTNPESSNNWAILPSRSSMNRGRGLTPFATCAISKGKVFVTGGQDETAPQSPCSEIFDNSTLLWTQKPAIGLKSAQLSNRSCYGFSTMNNFAVVCGNYSDADNNDCLTTSIFNSTTNIWATKSKQDIPIVGAAAFSMINLSSIQTKTASYESIDCYICGGIEEDAESSKVYKYSLYYDTWSYVNTMNQAREYPSGCANTADIAFVSGGYPVRTGDNVCENKFIQSFNVWVNIPSMYTQRYGHASSNINSDIYFITSGLRTELTDFAGVESESYYNSTNVWLQKIRASLNVVNRRALSGMARLQVGQLLLCGGATSALEAEDVNISSNVYRYTDGQTEFLGFAATDFRGATLNDK